MATPYDQRYRDPDGYDYDDGSGRYRGSWERNRHSGRLRDDRGFFNRAGDELRSWLGDEDAERRRRMDEFEDERYHRQGRAGRSGSSPADARAGDLMTRNVITVSPYDPVERAARLMRDHDCGALPVVNNLGRLIGMVTDRDISMRLVASGVDPRHSKVADCMTDETFACHVNEPIWGCMRQMSKHRIRRLPIVNDRDQVIGIISQGDMARYAEAYHETEGRRRVAQLVSEISEPSSAPYR